MEYKQFKDPIYGYIRIPSKYVNEIIDTNIFQRLRRIVQTSYSPLYPSALHNRFVHSIGVFHLGQIASNAILNTLKDMPAFEKIENLYDLIEIFKLACLLHDVGHAPFSHTGEKFFLDYSDENKSYFKLHEMLASEVDSEQFKNDIPKEDSNAAAPHEIMSSIIGIREFKDFFKSNFEREFFARCITLYKFSNDFEINSIYNCFISLVNSKVIDVDRLDYLIRDAYFTGFETINIDYERLLNSLTIVEKEIPKGKDTVTKYEIAYNKNAVSIIENVVYAHDAERKWIQTHPIVLYDMYIIQHVINSLNTSMESNGVSLFSMEALSADGITTSSGEKISLLCDDDIVHLLKRNTNDELYNEFFSRNIRRHPLWKSESEYKAYLSIQYAGQALEKLEKAIDETETYLRKYSESWIINDIIIEKVESELERIKKSNPDALDEKSRNKQLKSKETILKLMRCMKEYATSCECECNFVILKASQFYSSFNKNEFAKIPIVFQNKNDDNIFDFGKVVSVLSSTSESKKDFFYIYFKPNKEKPFNKEELCKKLYQAFM